MGEFTIRSTQWRGKQGQLKFILLQLPYRFKESTIITTIHDFFLSAQKQGQLRDAFIALLTFFY